MRRAAAIVVVSCLGAASGCAPNGGLQNPFLTPQSQAWQQQAQQQQQALAQQGEQWRRQFDALNRDNEELGGLLAQAKQQSRLLEDQVAALQQQLRGTTDELARVRDTYRETERKAETLAASAKRRASASFTPNRSLEARLPGREIPGVLARADGDVVRLELAAAGLFEPGGARLTAAGTQLLDATAAEIGADYGEHRLGVEGHTSNEPVRGDGWNSNHQLSVGRAMAVYDYLIARTRLQPGQLAVVGHGANHPVVSNATPAGRARNERVELVIYPETFESR